MVALMEGGPLRALSELKCWRSCWACSVHGSLGKSDKFKSLSGATPGSIGLDRCRFGAERVAERLGITSDSTMSDMPAPSLLSISFSLTARGEELRCLGGVPGLQVAGGAEDHRGERDLAVRVAGKYADAGWYAHAGCCAVGGSQAGR